MKSKLDLHSILEKLKKKENLVVVILIGVLLMVISFPTDSGKEISLPEEVSTETESGSEVEELERRLENILEKTQGVGKVKVMITLKSGREKILEKDVETTENTTEDSDGQGREQKTRDYSRHEETVTYSAGSGNSQPYVVKELEPEIEGVLVIAEGGDKPLVVKNISDAILALFPVEVHKIKVMKWVNE